MFGTAPSVALMRATSLPEGGFKGSLSEGAVAKRLRESESNTARHTARNVCYIFYHNGIPEPWDPFKRSRVRKTECLYGTALRAVLFLTAQSSREQI